MILRLTACAGALAVFAGGCASMPTSGSVQQISVQAGVGQQQDFPQLIPVSPGSDWTPAQIVTGFLAASASFANDHAVAREYLTPRLATTWRPNWAATVVTSAPSVQPMPGPKNLPTGEPLLYASAQISYQTVATVTRSGQYLPASGGPVGPLLVTLEKIAGQWRISRLPSPTPLILTESAFQLDYVPHNLYFYGPSGSSLIPDPVFVPQQESPAVPATGLVSALRQPPGGWLQGATSTSFPSGTKLIGGVSISATNAVVDLGGAAARVGKQRLRKMAAQIVWTLTSFSYSPSAITSVQLKINQKLVTPRLLLRQQYLHWVPTRPVPTSPLGGVFYLDRSGKVSVLSGGARLDRLPWPAGARVTQLAVAPEGGAAAPDGREIAGIVPRRHGCTIYAGQPSRGSGASSWSLGGGACTALSFDSQGNIWAAVGPHVWFLPADGGASVPVMTQFVPPSDTITALRVAPDGVRIAMIVRDPAGLAEILLGALTYSGAVAHKQLEIGQGSMQTVGSGIISPSALSWYDTDYLLVLSNAGKSSSQLYEVPLAGNTYTPINTPAGVLSVTTTGSAGSSEPLYIGTAAGQIMTSHGTNFLQWRTVTKGTDPVEPG
jgi:hypothetical protein